MRKIFIVGGAGFVGSHLVSVCLQQKYTVAVYDNFSTGRTELLSSDKNLRIYKGDILDKIKLSRAIKEFSPHVLYHLAAIHHIPTCEKVPDKALKVNIEGTLNVITGCLHAYVPRIVFISTGAVYALGKGPLTETHPLNPTDIYSISKICGEQLFRYYVRKGCKEAIIVRLFNVVGKNETNPHVIPDIMRQLVSGADTIRLGNLNTRRDYLHVEDAANALFLLGSVALPLALAVFNVGSGREYSVRELVNLSCGIVGRPIKVISAKELRRKIDRSRQLADIKKIKRATGWRPKHTLKQALQEIWSQLQDATRRPRK